MRLHQTVILFVLMALLFSPNYLAGEEKGPSSRFNDQQLKKLKAGEPVCVFKEDSGKNENVAGYGQCSIIIKAPIKKSFDILSKIDLQVHYVPGKKKSTIVNKTGNKLLIDNEYVFYGKSIKYHSIYTIDAQNLRFEFEIEKSRPHDLAENSGFYQFEKIDEKTTLLTYGATKFDTGFPIPDFVKKFLLGRSLPAMATNIKKYIESNGEWRREK